MLFSLSVNGNNREVKCYLESDNWIVQNLNNALETWNSKLSEIWQLLTQSPETFKGGDIWSVMLTIHDALKGIGYGLLVLFFAISVVKTCSSYLDVKKPEHAVKLFIRFALAKGAVGYGLELMMALFSVIQGMVSTIMQNSGFGGDSDVIELPAEMVEKIESVGLLDSIPLWIVTLLGSLFITVLSFIMILTVYGRMFKLYMYTAIAPIPIATFAGEPTQNIGKNFVRSYAGVCMEGAIIALACIIFSVFAASPPAIADSSLSAVNIVWNYVAELIFNLLVLVSLIVVLLISFIFGIIEITVIQTEKNLSRICADGAIFSVFGEYESQLMEAYHIFGLDGSYGTGEFNEDKIIGRMHYYSNKNIDYKINGIQYLTDNKGQAFREQVLTYMEQKYGIGLIEDLAGRTSVWEEESIQGEEIRQVEETILDEFEEIKSSGQSENEGADEEETESEDLAELEENPFQCLEQIERTGILSVAMPKDMPLSGRQIDLDLQASKRSLQTGRGKFPMRKNTDKAKEKLLFNEYIMQNFTQASKENISEYPDSDEKNRSLDYEIEYIISGKSSDKENLESVVTKIFFIRMALNYVYLMGDSVKKSEAMALAATISTLLLIPEAAEAVKQLMLLAWAAGEGVIDIRSLLSGNKVPLVKTSDNWQLTLASLFTLGIGDDGISGADAEEGITYKEYLRAFLFLQPEEETTMRTIDRIEENMRLEQNCEKFRADHCVTKCEIRNKVEIFGDLAYTFPSYYGYE